MKILAARCSSFGITTVTKIVAPDDRNGAGAAAVKMSTLEEADIVARELGDARCGRNVIITLLQKERATPFASRRNQLFHRGVNPEPQML